MSVQVRFFWCDRCHKSLPHEKGPDGNWRCQRCGRLMT
jgi:ribosomal protein L37AE/L43A